MDGSLTRDHGTGFVVQRHPWLAGTPPKGERDYNAGARAAARDGNSRSVRQEGVRLRTVAADKKLTARVRAEAKRQLSEQHMLTDSDDSQDERNRIRT